MDPGHTSPRRSAFIAPTIWLADHQLQAAGIPSPKLRRSSSQSQRSPPSCFRGAVAAYRQSVADRLWPSLSYPMDACLLARPSRAHKAARRRGLRRLLLIASEHAAYKERQRTKGVSPSHSALIDRPASSSSTHIAALPLRNKLERGVGLAALAR
jgi:hypothetical protein